MIEEGGNLRITRGVVVMNLPGNFSNYHIRPVYCRQFFYLPRKKRSFAGMTLSACVLCIPPNLLTTLYQFTSHFIFQSTHDLECVYFALLWEKKKEKKVI